MGFFSKLKNSFSSFVSKVTGQKSSGGGGGGGGGIAAMEADFQAAGDMFQEKIEKLMKDNIEQIVYGAGSPSTYQRTYAYEDAWSGSLQGDATSWTVELKYEPNGSHPSWWQSEDVTNGLDDLIINCGASTAVISFANWPRDHFTTTSAQAKQLALECIKACMG